eukprot:6478469-Amphidinium_carterae.1
MTRLRKLQVPSEQPILQWIAAKAPKKQAQNSYKTWPNIRQLQSHRKIGGNYTYVKFVALQK